MSSLKPTDGTTKQFNKIYFFQTRSKLINYIFIYSLNKRGKSQFKYIPLVKNL